MGENLGEEEANTLLTLIRSNRDDALKVDHLVQAKQKIKHYGIDANATESTFAALRIGMSQASNMTLFQHSLSCLGYLVKRCRANDATLLKRLSIDLLPLLLDKMGDPKDRIREMALSPVVDIWTVAPVETERIIRETGLTSKNARLKESSLEWLSRVYALYGGQLSIKPYTSLLVRLLEDASDGVREKAKHVVVDLFKSASGPAKADLQKSITDHQVRKTIATYITENISGPDIQTSVKAEKEKQKDEKPMRSGPKSSYLDSLAGVAMDDMKPAYANTGRELESEFNSMLADLSGRETEQNWAARERHVTRIRELLRGNAPTDHPAIFSAGMKMLCDGIVNVVKSLRTTVSTKGCQCVKDLFLVLGHGMDPTVDIILPVMIKLCGVTKKITAEAANVTCAIIFTRASYHSKIASYLYGACTDKNVQPRLYATSWLRAFIEAHAHEKYILDHGDGIKKLEDGLKKVLVDSNPTVRERARAVFWIYFDIFPDRGTVILEAQDPNTRKLLDKDNPNGSSGASASASASGSAGPSSRPVTTRAATTATTRPSIKEQIAARRKEVAAAQASKQPPKLEPAHSFSGPLSAGSSSSAHTAPEKSGISSAPVRPGRPMRPKSQLSVRVDEAKRPASSSSNGDSVNAIERTLERMNGNRAMSPSSSARSGFSPSASSYKKSSATSPPGTTRSIRTTVRASPLSYRKLTILEQLAHADHKVRLEGIVVLGCALAGRTPPNYDKKPPVPPSDQLAPALQKLLNDPNTEVVESVLAPEVLPELVKFVGYDQVVPRVLLLNEVDETEHPRPYPIKSLASLKELLTTAESTELLLKVITSMGSGGAMSRKILPGAVSFTSVQRRRILHGALEWMSALVGGDEIKPNEYLDQPETYKLFINRLVPMVPTTKQPNFTLLANILKNIQKRDPVIFDRNLATFDPGIQRDLKRAWGMRDGDGGTPRIEEEVAHVEKVLGIIPSVNEMPPPPRPNRGIEIPDVSQKNDFINDDEELTMINPMSALANLNIVPSTASVTPADTETRRSSGGSIDIPDFLGMKRSTTNGHGSANAREKELIQVYQDPTPTKPDPNTTKSPEPLANITNSVRPRQKNFGASTKAGKTPEQQLQSLQNYLRKLKDGDIDSHGLRRLCAIVRDNPAKREQQENKEAIDFWAGGQTFEELLDSLLDFLGEPLAGGSAKTAEELTDVRAQGVQLLRLLMSKATAYFTGREHSVFPVAFKLRGEYPTQSPVSTNIDDMVEEYAKSVADSGVALPTITSFLMKTTPDAGAGAEGGGKKKGGNVLALKTLASFVKDSDEEDLESQWGTVGTIAKRYMEDEDPEVRRAVVSVCVEMRKRFVNKGDAEEGEAKLWKDCLAGLTEGQRNLLTYYFARNG